MLLNYLKLSLRLLARNPFFTLINVVGLCVGFVAFFILWRHATSELKMDQYHKDYERIGRITGDWRWNEEGQLGHLTWSGIMAFQFNMIVSDFPEIEEHVQFISPDDMFMQYRGEGGQNIAYKEANVICSEPNLFEFFTIPLIYGDKSNVLNKANSVVLSQSAAIRYFGNTNPVDQLLTVDDTSTLVVTGVFEDLPHTTHLMFDMVTSNVGKERQWNDRVIFWSRNYIKVRDPEGFERLKRAIDANNKRYWEAILNIYPQGKGDMFIQPLQEIAYDKRPSDSFQGRSKFSLLVLAFVSVLILVMAWINYVNLTVSRISKRLKEIATRKVSGALSKDFFSQFVVDSLVMIILANAAGITLIQIIRTPVRQFFQIDVPEFQAVPLGTWCVMLLSMVSGVLITALYPALMSIGYNPRKLFTLHSRPSSKRLLPSLFTTFQYTAAFTLILWGFIMYSQLSFILRKDLGIDKANVVVFDAPTTPGKTRQGDIRAFISEVSKSHDATFSNTVFSENAAGFKVKRFGQEVFKVFPFTGGVDETFIPFFGIRLLAGRNFKPGEPADRVIISRRAAERLGYGKFDEALGDRIQLLAGITESQTESAEMEIVGIIEDYPLQSLLASDTQDADGGGVGLTAKNELFTSLSTERISIRLDPGMMEEQISGIEEEYKGIFPGSPVHWYFLDDSMNKSYNQEKISINQVVLFTCMAVGISCLGLLGMISNRIEESRREIGIRKVLGAAIQQICAVLLGATLRQVITAVALGMPIAYYLGQLYLERYTERVELQWWHFVLPVTILFGIMFSTIAVVLFKATRTNPAEALKYE